jgi:hypothetical protein
MRGLLLATTAALFWACPAGPSGEDPDPTPTETPCDAVAVESAEPADGSDEVFFDAAVRVRFSDEVFVAEITVREQGGVAAPGVTLITEDLMGAEFRPDAPLGPSTVYEATVTAEAADLCNVVESSWSWQTSVAGEPILDPSGLPGSVYVLDSSEAELLQPPAGGFFDDFLQLPLLLSVLATDDPLEPTTIDMAAAANDRGVQGTCTPTIDFAPAGFGDSPRFEVGPQDVQFSAAGNEATVEALEVSGYFLPDLSGLAGVRLLGYLNTAPLDALVGGGGAPAGTACLAMATTLGISCVRCPTSGGVLPACLPIETIRVRGQRVAIDWLEISADQTENHLCPGVCNDALDNDQDGSSDDDHECDPGLWP